MGEVQTGERTAHSYRVAGLSLLASGVLLAVKFVAYQLTDSAAGLSDALESIVNVIASGFALFSITLSARPPDASHPYGHGRVEFFSAGFEGALIAAAAVAIFWTAVPRVLSPQPIAQLSLGMALVCAAGVANALHSARRASPGRSPQSSVVQRPPWQLWRRINASSGQTGKNDEQSLAGFCRRATW